MEIKNTDQIMRADIMVARIQDKNELANAGDIYVGTGNAPDVVDASAGEDGKVANPTVKNIQTAVREDANRQQGLRLGEGTSSSYSNIVELGIGAKAEANSACQIGVGTNNVANSLQFRDKTVVNGNGEIEGDYPLGFTGRVSDINNVTWKDAWHNDIQSKNPKLITDWAFRDTSQLPWSTGEIAFVSTYEPSQAGGSPTKTNIVLDGRVYVDLGAHKVYAEGDKVGSAVNADNAGKLNNIVLTSVDDLINENGSIKINGCVSFTIFDREVVLDSYHTIPVYSKGIIVGVETSDLAIIYTSSAESGCLYYDATGKQWHWAFPEKATNADNATNAINTSFTNTPWKSGLPQDIKLTEFGTYQFIWDRINLGLIYWDGNIAVNGTLGVLYEGTASSIEDGYTFFIRITSGGLVEIYNNLSSGPVRVTTSVALKYRKIS